METNFERVDVPSATDIASYALCSPEHHYIELGQAVHRVNLLKHWQIPVGSHVLEIGCGQGTTTAALAEAVGPNGHVDAVDPASPDYGSPLTLAQAQSHLSKGPIGNRITWHNEDPIEFLKKRPSNSWDFVVFAHCIWYFDGPHVLSEMLKDLKGRTKAVLFAEYALKATENAALPHVMAAVARATLEAYRNDSLANIWSLMSPQAIKSAAEAQGWTIVSEENIVPEEDLLDGSWESSTVRSDSFVNEIEAYVKDAKVASVLQSARDGLRSAVSDLNGKRVRTMDVWSARFN